MVMWKVYIEYRVAVDRERAFRAALPSLKKEMKELPGGAVSSWSLWEGWDQPNLFVEEVLCGSLQAAQGVAATVDPPAPTGKRAETVSPAEGRGAMAEGDAHHEEGDKERSLLPPQLNLLRQWAARRADLGAHRFHVWIFEER
ncbi:MAG TPA: hypothetical protein GX517_11255 [Alicyclobacillus sp.]|nr:hypothetical protein [Alicyclobacillus sp.]